MRVIDLRIVKFWILVTIAALFAYNLYWLIDSFVGNGYNIGFGMVVNAFKMLTGIPTGYSAIWVAGHASSVIGLMARFFELSLALFLLGMLWWRGKTFLSLRDWATAAVFLEGFYFLFFLLPGFMVFSISNVFALSYFLQILLISPLLILLSFRLKTDWGNVSTMKLLSLAYAGYVSAIWVNNVSRWIVVAQENGIQSILSGTTSVGFANAAVVLSLSLALSGATVFVFLKQQNQKLTTKLLGLSLFALGAYFLNYLVYSLFTGSLGSVLLVEVWAVPLLGLGASLLYEANTRGTAINQENLYEVRATKSIVERDCFV